MTAKPMSEDQMVHLVRNTLLTAGQEMGNGDQWPVIKDTIYKLAKDWESLKATRNVEEELKVHLLEQLNEMEAGLPACTPEARAKIEPIIKECREVYEAYFSDVDRGVVFYDAEEAPEHIKRMKTILSTMEDTDA